VIQAQLLHICNCSAQAYKPSCNAAALLLQLATNLCGSFSVKLMPAAPARSASSDEKASMLPDSTGEP
jgi:hypothetical protein